MSEATRLPLPTPGTDLVGFLETQLDVLGPAMDLNVTEHDELAQVTGLRIASAAMTAAAVELQYVVQWQAFHACSGQYVAGESLRVLRGRLEGLAWVFERHCPPPARDTVDEF